MNKEGYHDPTAETAMKRVELQHRNKIKLVNHIIAGVLELAVMELEGKISVRKKIKK